MANSLEKFFLNKLKQMPPVEVELTNTDKKGGAKTPVARGKKVIDNNDETKQRMQKY